MNYKDKKNDNMEFDDMKIKSHLNASLDLSGISVSEDLINRTLEAIKKQSAEQQTGTAAEISKKEPSKKVIPWNRYIRGFAGVAAAALIIVAGYGLLSSGVAGNKTMDEAAQDSRVDYDMASSTSAQENGSAGTAAVAPEDSTLMAKGDENTADTGTTGKDTSNGGTDGSADNQATQQFTIAADASIASEGSMTDSYGQAVPGEATLPQVKQELQSTANAPLAFRDIFLPDPAQAQSLTIDDGVNATSITLTDKNEILDFYSVMDKHQFTVSTDANTGTDYTVEIKSLQPGQALYTMTVGNYVTISYQDSEAVSQSIYNADDNALLLQDLKDFFSKYSK